MLRKHPVVCLDLLTLSLILAHLLLGNVFRWKFPAPEIIEHSREIGNLPLYVPPMVPITLMGKWQWPLKELLHLLACRPAHPTANRLSKQFLRIVRTLTLLIFVLPYNPVAPVKVLTTLLTLPTAKVSDGIPLSYSPGPGDVSV